MGAKRFNITLPEELLVKLDAAAKENYFSRSGYIQQAVAEKIERALSYEEVRRQKLRNYLRRNINRRSA